MIAQIRTTSAKASRANLIVAMSEATGTISTDVESWRPRKRAMFSTTSQAAATGTAIKASRAAPASLSEAQMVTT